MNAILYKLFFKHPFANKIIVFGIFLLIPYCIKAQDQQKKTISTVVIDPGHGGKDPGSLIKHIYEKDIVLSIALKLGNYIKKNLPDVKVIYTRSTDVFIPLEKRAEIANKNQADLFISIHSNISKSSVAKGTETFVMGLSKTEQNLEVAKKENAAISYEEDYKSKYGGYDPNSDESFIIFQFVQNTYLNQSLDFANYIQDQFSNHAKRTNRGVKQAGFLVLWKTTMPSVLVEAGFISNSSEQKYLTSSQGQDKLAYSIFNAFNDYKQKIEGQSLYSTQNSDSGSIETLPINNETVDEVLPVKDTMPEETNNNTDNQINFTVQISSSKKPISTSSSFFKGLKGVDQYKTSNGYKYLVGRKDTYEEITEYLKIIKNYFPDAFVIALQNGKIIPLKEALNKINN